MKYFPRRGLAAELADALQGRSHFSDAPNGLFLAAPRRTGKSTFLQLDLQPELERRQVVVVYVDLWADQRREPGSLIAEAIGRALLQKQGLVAKAAKAGGLDSINAFGIKLDAGKIGQTGGATLTDALRALHVVAKSPVALIVDEAQHALTSDTGEIAMAALKSARDQLNQPGGVNLMLIMSGSDRDKLLRLVNSNAAPFFGSQIQRMPELGADFIAHIAQLIRQQRPDLGDISHAALLRAFTMFGQRPQFFIQALGQVLNPVAELDGRFEDALLACAEQSRSNDEMRMRSIFLALKPLEQAVLWRLLALGPRFRPYDAEALAFYREKTGLGVTVAQAQKALHGLRERQPSIIWKSARSEYALDDTAMQAWYIQCVAAEAWPPTGPPLDFGDE